MKVYLIAPRDGSSECPTFAYREEAEEVARMVSRWIGKCRVEEITISDKDKPQWDTVAFFAEGESVEAKDFWPWRIPDDFREKVT